MAHSRPWRACGDDLHVRVKDTLVQPQSEREAALTGREPSQAMGTICENRRGGESPVQAVPAAVRPVPETMSAVYKQYFKAVSA